MTDEEVFYDVGLCIKGCKICHGIGWLRKEVPIHHEHFGKITPCPNRKFVHFDPKLGISIEEAMTLDWNTYEPTEAVLAMRSAIDRVLARGYGWIYIYGQPGNGKTIMAKSACIFASTSQQKKTRYYRLSSLINKLRASYDEEHGQTVYRERLKELGEIEVLAVDEIGRDRQTDFSKQSLSELMDRRYELAVERKGVTIWVSNFSPEEVLELYQSDRVRDGRFDVLEIKGASMRPVMQDKQDENGGYWWMND